MLLGAPPSICHLVPGSSVSPSKTPTQACYTGQGVVHWPHTWPPTELPQASHCADQFWPHTGCCGTEFQVPHCPRTPSWFAELWILLVVRVNSSLAHVPSRLPASLLLRTPQSALWRQKLVSHAWAQISVLLPNMGIHGGGCSNVNTQNGT